jgi:hypothetical protein
MPTPSLPRPLSDTDLEIKTAIAYRDLVRLCGQAVIDRRRTFVGVERDHFLVEAIVRDLVQMLTTPHDLHESVTQFYRAEVRRLREQLAVKDLVIQQLGQAVAGREMVAAR